MRRPKPERCVMRGWAKSNRLSLFRGFVRVFQINAEVAVNTRFAVDAKPEALVVDLIKNALAEFDDVLLKRLIAGWVVQYLSDDTGIAWAQHVVFRNSNQIAHTETRHKGIV
jgi:hypothetical protein